MSKMRRNLIASIIMMLAIAGLLPQGSVFAAAVPSTTINISPEVFIGEQIGTSTIFGAPTTFTVTFDNTDADETGYGPFVELVLPAAGIDSNDGITFASATYLGQPLAPAATITCTTGTFINPLVLPANTARACTPGTQIVILQIPFGSFTPDQPPAVISVRANVSNLADVGTPLTINASSGFIFGDSPTGTASTFQAAPSSASTTPILFTSRKRYIGPEDETATGRNYPRQYVIEADIANGQTIASFVLSDVLDNTMQFISYVTSTPVGTPGLTPSTTVPGGTYSRNFASVTGALGFPEATVTFEFYIPRDDSTGTPVLNLTTGAFRTRDNNSAATGSWTPIDTRDGGARTVTVDPAGPEHQLQEQSIATQKSVAIVTDTGASGLSPGDTLEYTIVYQVSDYFAFDTLVSTDTFSDGQRFLCSFIPTFTASEQSGAPTATGTFTFSSCTSGLTDNTAFSGPFFSVDRSQIQNTVQPSAGNGSTQLTFNVSGLLATIGANDGLLVGAEIPQGGTGGPIPANANPATRPSTTFQIVFRTVVQADFTDLYGPVTNRRVDQGDTLTNGNIISGRVLNYVDLTPTANTVTDDTGTTLRIPIGAVSKSIYAIRGVTPAPVPAELATFETVTYRIQYTLPTCSVEDFRVIDYVPLPVFNVADPNADGTPNAFVFQDLQDATVPATGVAKYGPNDTFSSRIGVLNGTPGTSVTVPTVTTNTANGNNFIQFEFGDFSANTTDPCNLDILFTITANDRPFADGLFLTNQVRAIERDTSATNSPTDAIIPIELTEPVIAPNFRKGVIATNRLTPEGAVFTQGIAVTNQFTFNAAGCPAFAANITSANVSSFNNSNLTGIDADDIVTFAIFVQNSGSGLNGAFDIRVRDAIPNGYTIPASGLQLCVRNGTGTALPFTQSGAGLFSPTGYLELTDPSASAGALARGTDSSGQPINNGLNIAVITYNLRLDRATETNTVGDPSPTADPTSPNRTRTNTASLLRFAGREGGTNFITGTTADAPSNQVSDPADTVSRPIAVAKTLIATNQAFTTTNVPLNGEDVAIGEIVTYRLVVSVPEGVVNNFRIIDELPQGMAFVGCTINNPPATEIEASPGINLVSAGAATKSLTTCTEGTGNNDFPEVGNTARGAGTQIVFFYGNINNTNADNTVNEIIVITYQAVVTNVPTNQDNTTRENGARVTYDVGPGGNPPPALQRARVIIQEPNPTVDKSIPSNDPNLDVGDTVGFQIVVTGAELNAYDVVMTDRLPVDPTPVVLDLVIGSVTITTAGCAVTPTNTSNDGTNTVSFATSTLEVGCVVTVNFNAVVTTAASAGATYTNTARLTFTSLPGDFNDSPTQLSSFADVNNPAVERTGDITDPGGTANDYRREDAQNVVVSNPVPAKSIVASSEASTANGTTDQTTTSTGVTTANATIGEIIRYRIEVRIPEVVDNSLDNFVITDVLPTGMTFLPTNVRFALVATENAQPPTTNGLVSSIAAINAGRRVGDFFNLDTFTGATLEPLPPAQISGGGASGADPIFSFGNIKNYDNDATGNPAGEYIVVEFNAIVDNSGTSAADSNDANETLRNGVTVTFGTSGSQTLLPSSANAPVVTVQEPAIINVNKTALPVGGDAGDTITYTVTYSNTGTTTAFDVVLFDPIPAGITLVNGGSTTTFAGGSCGTPTATTTYVGDELLVRINQLPVGCAVTTTYTATVDALAQPTEVFTNTATVSYTSLPGTNGTVSNPTGSAVTDAPVALGSGAPGTASGERDNGANGRPAVNDYTDDDPATFTVAPPTITKNTPAATIHAIGDLVTYNILVTLPEGASVNTRVTDVIPVGMAYEGATLITTGAPLTSPFNGTFLSAFAPPAATGNGDDVTFTLGQINTTPDNVTTNNTFALVLQVRVLNVVSNQNLTVLTNSANVAINRPGGGPDVTANSANVDITVREPQITTVKTITNPSPANNVQAGDIVTYSVVLTNTGAVTAYDVTFLDTLAQGVSYNTGSLTCNAFGTATIDSTTATTGAGTVTVGRFDIPPTSANNNRIECTYTVTVQQGVTLLGAKVNTANANWTSQNNEPTETGYNPNDRVYNDNPQYPIDTNTDVDDAVFNTQGVSALTKSDGNPGSVSPSVRIGDTVTYTITFTSPRGTLNNLVIADSLPAGQAYIAGTETVTGISNAASVAYNGATRVLTYSWTAANVVSSPVTLTFQARILNDETAGVPNNVNGQVKTNTVTLNYQNAAGVAQPQQSATDQLTIVEPRVTAAKTILTPSPANNLQAGQQVEYQVVLGNNGFATAYEVTFVDTIAQGTTFDVANGVSCTVSGGASIDGGTETAVVSGGTVTFGTFDIPVGATVTCIYRVTVNSAVFLVGARPNVVNANWTSQDGTANTDERTYNDDPKYTIDLNQDIATVSFSTQPPTLTKSDGGAGALPNVAIGDTVTYTLTVGSSLGTLRDAVLTDVLPVQLEYVTGTQSVSAGVNTPTFAYDAATRTLSWTFPAPGATFTANSVTFTFQAKVKNNDANLNLQVKTNNAALNFSNAAGVAQPPRTASDQLTIREPSIVLTKEITNPSPATGIISGSVLTYRVIMTNSNNIVTAFETQFVDTLALGTTYNAGSVTCTVSAGSSIDGGATSASVSGGLLTVGFFDLAPNGVATCLYTVTVGDAIPLGSTVPNIANANWTSQNGTTDPDDRIYNDNPVYTIDLGTGNVPQPNTDVDDATFTTPAPTFVKSDNGTASATIGDVINYTLTITSARGTINSLIVQDVLPVELEYITGSQAFTGLTPTNATPFTQTGQTLRWDFGNTFITGPTATITFQARVNNIPATEVGDTVTNPATLTYTPLNGTPTTLPSSDSFNIVEPQIQTAKSVTSGNYVAGDTVPYVVRFTNVGGSTAHNVTFTDLVPVVLVYTPGSIQCRLNGVGAPIATVSATYVSPGLSVTGLGSILPTQFVECTYTGTAQPGIQNNVNYTNVADADWTSQLDTTNPDNRVYNDPNPPYIVDGNLDTDDATFRADATALIFSKADNRAQMTIGDEITYTLRLQGSLTTYQNIVIVDTLPAGLTYIAGSTVITGINPANLPNNPEPQIAGQVLTYNFGDTNLTATSATVVFRARLTNVDGNQRPQVRTNSATLDYAILDVNTGTEVAQPQQSDTEDVTIIEPNIDTTKTVTNGANVQAGDVVTYTVVFTNVGDSPAYNVTAIDDLPDDVLDYNEDAVCLLNGTGAPIGLATPGVGNTVTFTGLGTIPAGEFIRCVYTATATALFQPGAASYVNTVDADWTSQADATVTDNRTYNDTNPNIEVDLEAVAGNDDQADAEVTPIALALDMTKTGDRATATIGDLVTYTLTITAQRGTVEAVVVNDVLPDNFIYDTAFSYTITGISTVPTFTQTGVNDGTGAGANAVTLNWNFGDAVFTNNTATIVFRARVANNNGNQRGNTKTNNVTLTYNNPDGTAAPQETGTFTTTLIEAQLVATKSVTPNTAVEAGDTLTYTFRFTNNGDSPAYNVTALDDLPDTTVTYNTGSLVCRLNNATTLTTIVTPGAGNTLAITGLGTIPVGAFVECTYTVTVTSAIRPGDVAQQNVVDGDWTSQSDPTVPDNRNYDDSNTVIVVDGPPELDNTEATFTPAAQTVTLDKSVTPATARIGEVVTYTLTISAPLGTLDNTTITDTLPAGVQFDTTFTPVFSGISGSVTPTVSAPNDGTAPITLTWALGNVVVSTDPATITYRGIVKNVTANTTGRALTNTASLVFNNPQTGTPVTPITDTATTTVAEANIVTTKSVNPTSGVQSGNVLTYTVTFTNNGTATAYDVTILDILAPGVTYNAGSATCSVPVTVTAAGNTITFDGNPAGSIDIAPAGVVTCTYTVTAQPSIILDASLVNTIDADWTSLDGTNAEERTYNDSTATPVTVDDDNNNEDQATATFTTLGPTIDKTHTGGNSFQIGDEITYTLTITSPTGTLQDLVIVDDLPTGLGYNVGSLVIGTGISPTNPTITAPGGNGTDITIDFGDAVISTSPFTITFRATVLDVSTNVSGTVLTNGVALNYTTGSNVPRTLTDNDNVVVVEPVLGITKDITPSQAGIGETVTVTLTLTNTGTGEARDVVVTDPISTNEFNTITDTTAASQQPYTFAAPTAGGTTTVTYSGFNIAPNTTKTFTFTMRIGVPVTRVGDTLTNTATATYDSQTGNVPGQRVYPPVSGTDTVLVLGPNLRIVKTDSPDPVAVNSTLTYTLTVTNVGAVTATDATLSDPLPPGTQFSNVSTTQGTCTFAAGTVTCNFGSITTTQAPIVVRINVIVLGTAVSPLSNTATVTSSNGDSDPSDNADTEPTTLGTGTIDIGVTKDDGVIRYTPGGTLTYTIVVTNNSAVAVSGVQVADTFPASLTNPTWTCVASAGGSCTTPNGTGNIATTVNLAPNGTATFTVTVTVAATATGSITNTVTITPPANVNDSNPNNNTATDTDLPPNSQAADLSIVKDDGTFTYTPGSPIQYRLVVRNLGPDAATGATVIDNVPASISIASVVCDAPSAGASCNLNSGLSNNVNVTVNLPANGQITIVINGIVAAGTTGTLTNVATVNPPPTVPDPNPSNNTDDDVDNPPSGTTTDLSIVKTDGLTEYTPGGAITYTITASNLGPAAVTGAVITDNVPAVITNVTWTCASSAATSSCVVATGAGNNISVPANIAVGDSIVITVNGTVSPGFTGNLVNTATIAPPSGVTDTNPNNNTSTDTDTPPGGTPGNVDVGILKTDNTNTYTPGGALTYVITVTNFSSTAVNNVAVADTFPAGFTVSSWNCTASAGSNCNAPTTGTGNINTTVNLLGNGVATFTVNGTVSASQTGDLVNTATVTLPPGLTDPDPSDNSSTDTDLPPGSNFADLSVVKDNGQTTYTVDSPITYTITVSNTGNLTVNGAIFADNVPATITNVTYTCSSTTGAVCSAVQGVGNAINLTLDLPANSNAVITVSGTISPSTTGALVNEASISLPPGFPTPDPNPSNNVDNDIDTTGADLSIVKTDNTDTYTPGSPLTYTITVTNIGTVAVNGAVVTDPAPNGFTPTNWTCTTTAGNSCGAPSGTGSLSVVVNLLPGGVATIQYTGTLSTTLTGELRNVARVDLPPGLVDPTPSNNVAIDTDNPVGAPPGATPVPNVSVGDPAIVKLVDLGLALPGEEVVFTLKARNNGGAPATNVVVDDQIPPPYFVVVSATTTKGTFTITGNDVQFFIGTLAPNEEVTMTITTRVRNDAPVPVTGINTGFLSADGVTRRSSSAEVRIVRNRTGEDGLTLPATGFPPAPPVDVPAAVIPVVVIGLALAGLLVRRNLRRKRSA